MKLPFDPVTKSRKLSKIKLIHACFTIPTQDRLLRIFIAESFSLSKQFATGQLHSSPSVEGLFSSPYTFTTSGKYTHFILNYKTVYVEVLNVYLFVMRSKCQKSTFWLSGYYSTENSLLKLK